MAENFGYGPATPIKLRRVAAILPWVITMTARHLQRFGGQFCYFDANAGPGRYQLPDGGWLDGSPVIALLAIAQLDVPYRALLVEQDATRAQRLEEVLRARGLFDQRCVTIRAEDNRLVLPLACQFPSSRRDRGLIFFDAKGEPSWSLIDAVMGLPSMQRVDALLNVPTNWLKLARGAAQSATYGGKGYKWDTKDVRPLTERLAVLHKPRLLIGEPTRDSWGWSLVLGSSWAGFPEWRAGQLDAADSATGSARLARISFTKGEQRASALADAPRIPGLEGGLQP